MATIEDLELRVHSLECQLANYHADLEGALEHDRQFQMKATWGIVNTLVGVSAFFGVLWATDKWLKMDGWFLGMIAGVAAFVAWGAAAAWSDRGREGDLAKLPHLPRWERHPERD